jgi:ribonuclease HII
LKDVADNSFFSETMKAVAECSAFSVKPSFKIEKLLVSRGINLIAGVDEVGRGALAGPLCVGMVIYDASFILSTNRLNGIDDSKKLSHEKRVAALDIIASNCLFATSLLVSHRMIDRMNVNGATEYAVNKLLGSISVKPDLVLLDGNFSFNLSFPIIPLVKGDTRSVSVASASIVAKVRRDMLLDRFDMLYPGYHFSSNKGYGTRRHIRAIYEIGFSPLHRRSYEPVKGLISSDS